MKKVISLFLVLVMSVSFVFTAFADATDKQMEQVLLSVKERIGGTDAFDEFDSSYWESNGFKVYDFSWSMQDGKDYINVSATESGVITSYYRYYESERRTDGKITLNKLTSDEALKKAQEMVNALNPEIAGTIVVAKRSETEDLYSNEFRFNVQRYENGFEVKGDNGSVRVNADADRIISFYLNYTDNVVFLAPEKIIKAEEARDAFSSKLGMKLQYMTEYDYSENTKKVYAAYVPANEESVYINAVTGEVQELFTGGYYIYNTMKEEAVADMSAGGANFKFSEAEQKNLEELSNLLSEDEIKKIVTENKFLNVSKTDNLKVYLNKESYSEKYYYTVNSESEEVYCSVKTDASSGEILSYTFYNYADEKPTSEKLSEDELLKKKEEVISALAGEKFAEYKKDNEEDDFYTRYLNDIPYVDDTVSAELDEYTGELVRYRISYTDYVDFPALDGVISAYDAGINLTNYAEYKPCYIISSKDEKTALPEISTLVYDFEDGYTLKIDAFSGKLLGYGSEEYEVKKQPEYTDISGHYAESKIKELAKYGIGFEGESFKPDNAILQKEYISLLVSVFLYNGVEPVNDENTDTFYEEAMYRGIISEDEVSKEKEVTRFDAVKYFVRAIGAEQYALLSGIYVSPFKDVTENIGYTALLYGMGIINGDEYGNFNGNGILTRADAIIVMHNYLSK